jgi:hypothetical protein
LILLKKTDFLDAHFVASCAAACPPRARAVARASVTAGPSKMLLLIATVALLATSVTVDTAHDVPPHLALLAPAPPLPPSRYMGFYANEWYDSWDRGGSRLASVANASAWLNMLISENSSFLAAAHAVQPSLTTMLATKWLFFESDPVACGSPIPHNCSVMRAASPARAKQTMAGLKPLLASGAVRGFFLGDEVNAPFVEINTTVALVRDELGSKAAGGPLLYINQMQIFMGPDLHAPCTPGMLPAASEVRLHGEPCRGKGLKTSDCYWPSVPPGLDLVGFDMYATGAKEVAAARAYASKCLYPLLAPHQRFVAVPGLFASASLPLDPQDESLEQKLHAYGASKCALHQR